MLPGRLKRVAGSLKFRLTLWNTAAVLVLLVSCLIAIRAGIQMTLLQMLNEFLEEELTTATATVHRFPQQPVQMHEELNRQARAHPRRQLFLQLSNTSGHLAWSSEHTPLLPDHLETRLEIGTPHDVGDYRVVQRHLNSPDGAGVTLRAGCAEFRTMARLRRITEMLILVGAVMLLVIPVGGYWLARRATKPLADIIKTTAGLHPASLQERLPVRYTQDELDDLARTINGLLDRIAGYLEQNREFTANVAHELRSPLAAMQFFPGTRSQCRSLYRGVQGFFGRSFGGMR